MTTTVPPLSARGHIENDHDSTVCGPDVRQTGPDIELRLTDRKAPRCLLWDVVPRHDDRLPKILWSLPRVEGCTTIPKLQALVYDILPSVPESGGRSVYNSWHKPYRA